MTDTRNPLPLTRSRAEEIFPILTPAQIHRIAAHGHMRVTRSGEVLVEQGDTAVPFFAVVSGEIEVLRPLGAVDLSAARWPLARPPHFLEASVPRVFAAGDVRSGSIKRIASAVGEGSAAISFVHQVLRE